MQALLYWPQKNSIIWAAPPILLDLLPEHFAQALLLRSPFLFVHSARFEVTKAPFICRYKGPAARSLCAVLGRHNLLACCV